MTGGCERVVVTGRGPVSSIGTGTAEFTEGLRSGRNEVAPLTAFDTTGFTTSLGCEVTGFDPAGWITRTPVDTLGRASSFAVAAAAMALAEAGLTGDDLRHRPGHIAVGTADGESQELDALAEQTLLRGADRMDQALVDRAWTHRLSAAIAWEFGLQDVSPMTFPTACSAGNYAIGDGLDAIRLGDADYALVGGVDAVCRRSFASFHRLGIMSPDRCRPFDADRQGILSGEGAGILLLESLTAARARGATILAEVLGYGINCDAHHAFAPEEKSIQACMESALRDARVTPGDVDLISAHGTGTPSNDVTEVRAVKAVYGESPPPVVSLKSMLGHSMGASSALGAIASTIAINEGFLPPTVNHRTTDPECAIDCVPNHSVPAEVSIVQNNGFAFNGNNAITLIGRYEETS
ncbi:MULTISPECIES: beta-ketoacyl-[acyl-carrier-protein] synthase family protein [Streptomyces]|uniref:beta-ketoacyl-[acyl-carrier-protein] synthase family protein n=1 Tax=Streptomyces TaxID=1883 RepID=UPI001E61B86B|nr:MULTISPECIES: beta-ketoacyl-[acyl-carrier-protein] synthase family protein [Streptomyces]UFQ17182.1 beta-ketoacyl-[acyl-carrier-protein] synthase family protein [Streptomyces huasconensis]WCL86782.1 beta-ketoacyl-[acyl-carrier-protein] synthase family protein [Streptomyces sp. JCM 35825]